MEEKILFKESQKFRQWWLIALVIGLNVLFLLTLYFKFISAESIDDKLSNQWPLILAAVFNELMTALFFIIRLETIITEESISIRFFPFLLKPKIIFRSEIKAIFVREYKPIMEYGGWGIKGSSKNRAYNISGNVGLQILLKDDKKLLVGTHKKEELETLLKSSSFSSQ